MSQTNTDRAQNGHEEEWYYMPVPPEEPVAEAECFASLETAQSEGLMHSSLSVISCSHEKNDISCTLDKYDAQAPPAESACKYSLGLVSLVTLADPVLIK